MTEREKERTKKGKSYHLLISVFILGRCLLCETETFPLQDEPRGYIIDKTVRDLSYWLDYSFLSIQQNQVHFLYCLFLFLIAFPSSPSSPSFPPPSLTLLSLCN